MEILCLNIRLLSESDLWVQNSVNKESYVDWSMFPTNYLALQQKGGFQTWTIFYFITKQGIQRMRDSLSSPWTSPLHF